MIQLNLLPDVKLEYIKTKRIKRLVISSALLVVAVSIGAFIFMFTFVNGVQKKHLSNLDKDIDKDVAEIQNTPEINEILTVQNQLSVVNGKHDEKPAAVRILPYISQLIPADTAITELNVDFTTGVIQIGGKTKDLALTNKFVDTLKFATYKTESGIEGKPFSEVVLASYGTGTDGASGLEFTINAKFDPVIFDNGEVVTITVPGIVSTRSSTEKPDIKFDQKSQPATEGGQ